MSAMDEFKAELASRLLGKAITQPSVWAEKRRVMGEPFPGAYGYDFHPWCRAMHDSKATWNVSMKSAQAGYTEVGINLALYYVDVLKRSVLYVLPTWGDACDFSRSRFNPALRLSPYLKDAFTDTNNVGLKMAGNVALYIRGSRGDANLKSIPVSILILDELDEMDQSQIELAMHRLRGQTNKKIWMISTPTTINHGVSLEFAKSTQEHFRFRCPGCGKIDELQFPESLHICGEDFNDPDCYRSQFQCTMCSYRYKTETRDDGFVIQEDKLETLRNTGFWEPTVSDTDPNRRGFKINQLYSYTVSPGEIVMDHFKAMTSEFANQEFHKSVLGVPYVGDHSQVTDELIQATVREYKRKQLVPKVGDGRLITLGIDQGKWSYYVVAEWFYPAMTVDLNTAAECRILDAGKYYEDDWEEIPDRLMHEYQIRACMVDADPNIQEARRFARRFPGFVWLNRYRQGRTGKEMTIDDDGSYAPIAMVDRTNWLDISMGRFYSKRIEIPCDMPRTFGEHLKNLVRQYEEDKDGNVTAFYRKYGPDHFAHALNYAEMALPCAASVATSANISKFL